MGVRSPQRGPLWSGGLHNHLSFVVKRARKAGLDAVGIDHVLAEAFGAGRAFRFNPFTKEQRRELIASQCRPAVHDFVELTARHAGGAEWPDMYLHEAKLLLRDATRSDLYGSGKSIAEPIPEWNPQVAILMAAAMHEAARRGNVATTTNLVFTAARRWAPDSTRRWADSHGMDVNDLNDESYPVGRWGVLTYAPAVTTALWMGLIDSWRHPWLTWPARLYFHDSVSRYGALGRVVQREAMRQAFGAGAKVTDPIHILAAVAYLPEHCRRRETVVRPDLDPTLETATAWLEEHSVTAEDLISFLHTTTIPSGPVVHARFPHWNRNPSDSLAGENSLHVFESAYIRAHEHGRTRVTAADLLLTMLEKPDPTVTQYLTTRDINLDPKELRQRLT